MSFSAATCEIQSPNNDDFLLIATRPQAIRKNPKVSTLQPDAPIHGYLDSETRAASTEALPHFLDLPGCFSADT
eukprot:9467592-Pyramimonas_sp.AAC.1